MSDHNNQVHQQMLVGPMPQYSLPTRSQLIDVAHRCLAKGWYVFPLVEKSKIPDGALAPYGFNSSSNDPNQIREWWTKSPNANIGIDLGRSNLTVLDFDNGKPPVELELPTTLQINTSRGTHVYLQGVSKQGDMHFNGVHIGEIKSAGGYVLSPLSIHPTGAIYSIAVQAPIAPIPEGLIDRLRPARKPSPTINGEKIPRGSHDKELTRIGGRLRHDGLEENAITDALIEVCEKRCENHGSDYREMCEKIAKSVSRYSVGKSVEITMSRPATDVDITATVDEEPEIEDSEIAVRPEFPRWVLEGTSLNEYLVKPSCEHSSKYPELIFIPAVQLYLNALALQVKLKNTPKVVLNMFVGVIAPYGQYFKSTCCELGHEYFNLMGLAQKYSRDVKEANGKTIITSIGSTEGLGKAMQQINGNKAILYFDELGKFAGKAGIENSSFGEDLLSFYESNVFGNTTKDARSNYNFDAKSYCFGWQWCTTDRAFPRHWAKLDNISSGLNDRMFLLLAPETPKEAGMYVEPDLTSGAAKTRALIDKAVKQGAYEYENLLFASGKFRGLDARGLAAAERLALYFAADLGLEKISDDCVKRARALADYRRAVLQYLDPVEAETMQGRIQQEITRELRRNGGKMPYRQLHHELHGERLGSGLWESSFNGLVNNGTVAVRGGKPGRGIGRPKMVYLLKQEDFLGWKAA